MTCHQPFCSTTNQISLNFFSIFRKREKTNVWMERFDKDFGMWVMRELSTWPMLWTTILHTISSLSVSLRWASVKTMVGCERWRGRLCYPSSMACHCAYSAFSVSPHRDFLGNTKLKPSSRFNPVLLSSISNAGVSYNTLVSEVLFSFLCLC